MAPDPPAGDAAPRVGERVGTVLQKTYRLERVLGVGGMGTVYAGRHVHLGHAVAVKVLHPHMAEQRVALERFRREAQIASQLGHPGLVSVLDFNATEDGAPYMVMELLQGQTLQERLTGGALPLRETCGVFTQLCDALHAVHEAGVVHRDLKPENIFLLEPPPDEEQRPRGWTGQRSPWGAPRSAAQRVKVLDFGISKFQPQRAPDAPPGIELTSGMEVLGTPSYLAPEQASGDAHEADRRADVFALGTILYECLTGQRAFDGPHPVAIMRSMLTDPVPRVSERAPALPPALDEVVARACAKDPRARYGSARELKEALLGAAGPADAPATAPDEGAAPAAPPPEGWDSEGDTLFDAEVGALRRAAQEAYAEVTPTPPMPAPMMPSLLPSLLPPPGPAPAASLAPASARLAPLLPPQDAPPTVEVPALRAAPEHTETDGATGPVTPPRGETITQRPTDRPTALLDTLPIPPEGYSSPSRWAQGHEATIDGRHLPTRAPAGARAAAGGASRSWVVTLSTACVAVLLGVVVGMLVLKLMSPGAGPSLALERAQQLQRQLAEGEDLAAQGRCDAALGRARAVLKVEPQNARALGIQRACRK